MTLRFWTVFAFFCATVCWVHSEKRVINLGQQAGYYQGDIAIPAKNRNAILRARRWTDGIVYYDLGTEWNNDQLAMIKEGMQAVEKSTCIRFKQRANEPNYVKIRNMQGGCFSAGAGMQGGEQLLSLKDTNTSTCFTHATIVHELLHAIGLWHEQSRYDRDNHIKIHWENLENSTQLRWQFRLVPESESNTYGIPYNYLSVMHYDAFTASINGDVTMEPNDKKYLREIGNVAYAHEWDWEKVRRIYECKETYTPAPTTEAPCIDRIDYCHQYLEQCQAAIWMFKSCRYSCGFCGSGTVATRSTPKPTVRTTTRPTPPAVCEDKITYCNQYLSVCNKEEWMSEACPKSCRMC